MKRVLATILGLLCATSITLSAADAPQKKQLTEEQKALQKEMTAKYDANKDGKLDREERAKISAEDKEKMQKAGLGGQRKQKKQEAK
jgi:hypothetical protein